MSNQLVGGPGDTALPAWTARYFQTYHNSLRYKPQHINTTTLYGGEIWGVHPRTAAQRHITTQKYSKHLRQLLRISPSVNMAVILSEIVFLSLQQQWLPASIRFWIYRDLMFDSLQEAVMPGPLNKGFVKGLHEQCAQLGFSLADMGLLPVSLTMIMNLSQLQQRIESDNVDTCPRTCPSAGAMVCTYRRWFLRDPGQGGRPFHRSSCRLMLARSHSFCASAWAATGYPVTWDAIGLILSHAMNVCAPVVL